MRREFEISVGPVGGGWSVYLAGSAEPMMFLSGARAEQQAKALARRLSASGDDARVLVHDRNSALVGSTRYFSALEAPSHGA